MSSRRLESEPFAGGNVAAYRAARRELRQQAATLLDVPIKSLRIAPGIVLIERFTGERWMPCCKDVADQHEWYLRHCSPDTRFRLALRIRLHS